MIRFQCESCGRLKGDGETWILGFAAENIGVTSARREISIASSGTALALLRRSPSISAQMNAGPRI